MNGRLTAELGTAQRKERERSDSRNARPYTIETLADLRRITACFTEDIRIENEDGEQVSIQYRFDRDPARLVILNA